ncbi:hypothetical protein V6N13_062393 [Hibiscus sabdariffa]|uniref:Uncharacterized protein n=1 Tax=Hibiscus sabdariffa TaxID=183260 RepID=A0ABR2NJA1_9ROSI
MRTHLRIARTKGEAALNESRGVTFASGIELFDDNIEIRRRRAVADADHAEDLAIGLEILPGAGRGSAQQEFEPERARVPWLVSEGGFLVLCVEGADGGERDRVVRQKHGVVVPQERRRDVADRKDGDSDHAGCLDADVGFHFLVISEVMIVWRCRWAGKFTNIRIERVGEAPEQSGRVRFR